MGLRRAGHGQNIGWLQMQSSPKAEAFKAKAFHRTCAEVVRLQIRQQLRRSAQRRQRQVRSNPAGVCAAAATAAVSFCAACGAAHGGPPLRRLQLVQAVQRKDCGGGAGARRRLSRIRRLARGLQQGIALLLTYEGKALCVQISFNVLRIRWSACAHIPPALRR